MFIKWMQCIDIRKWCSSDFQKKDGAYTLEIELHLIFIKRKLVRPHHTFMISILHQIFIWSSSSGLARAFPGWRQNKEENEENLRKKERHYRKMMKDWGNVLISPIPVWETGYGPVVIKPDPTVKLADEYLREDNILPGPIAFIKELPPG